MEPWVHNIIGLALAFDMVAAVGIVAGCCWAAWRYEYTPSEYIHVYKNYNYDYKGELKDADTANVSG
jgi:hypothetical protein